MEPQKTKYFLYPGVKPPVFNKDEQGAVISIDAYPRAVVVDGCDEQDPRLRKTVHDFSKIKSIPFYPGDKVVLGLGLIIETPQEWIATFVCGRVGSLIKEGIEVASSGPIYKGKGIQTRQEIFAVIRNTGKSKIDLTSDLCCVQLYFQQIFSPFVEPQEWPK
ncbi:MAG: hypothetical protein WDZ88_02400 [Candidatus Paceibacterota bacterium]